ncbi:MAG TPA: glycosyltransferase [Thermoanaerobaculia bacterium]|jgi:glycosyltransferase involved in cell wall biosynthesis
MTRLLWLIDSLTVGGAESLIIPFARRLDRSRYALTVCCLSTVAGNAIEPELRKEGVPIVNLGARNLRDRAAFRRLVALVKSEKFDLVHAHLPYASIWSAVLSRNTGVPSISSLHVAPSATRELHDSLRHRVLTEVRDRLMRFVMNRWSSRVISVSGALRDIYLARGGVDEAKMRVVHNGIELDRFRRDRASTRTQVEREFRLPHGAKIAVTVAVLRPKKGIEVLLEAAKRVPDAYFLIVGDGPKREEWNALAEQLGVADRIRWAGYRRDVDALLAGCDLFVHPSLDDAFPTVLLEAMAAGLPVVATRVGGIPEIVSEFTGTLVPAGDANELAMAIHALMNDDVARKRMSVAAEKTALENFSTEAWIGRLDAVYREVLAQ